MNKLIPPIQSDDLLVDIFIRACSCDRCPKCTVSRFKKSKGYSVCEPCRIRTGKLAELFAGQTPKHPAVQGYDWLNETLDNHYEYLSWEASPSAQINGSVPSAKALNYEQFKAAIQAHIDAAYQRGRIDEAKTCEEAKRHG